MTRTGRLYSALKSDPCRADYMELTASVARWWHDRGQWPRGRTHLGQSIESTLLQVYILSTAGRLGNIVFTSGSYFDCRLYSRNRNVSQKWSRGINNVTGWFKDLIMLDSSPVGKAWKMRRAQHYESKCSCYHHKWNLPQLDYLGNVSSLIQSDAFSRSWLATEKLWDAVHLCDRPLTTLPPYRHHFRI